MFRGKLVLTLSEREKFLIHKTALGMLTIMGKHTPKQSREILEHMVNARCHNMTTQEIIDLSQELIDEVLLSIGVYKELADYDNI